MHNFKETKNLTVSIKPLRDYLESMPVGIPLNAERIAALLSTCWASLVGSDATKMRGDKLWRLEDPKWISPFLDFSIERHGQTVNGSSRATLYRWRINVQDSTAEIIDEKRRQLYALDRRLDLKALAKEVADIIINGKEDLRVKAGKGGAVRLNIAEIIPETNKQTTSARRKRFRKQLNEILEPLGWKELRANTYAAVPLEAEKGHHRAADSRKAGPGTVRPETATSPRSTAFSSSGTPRD